MHGNSLELFKKHALPLIKPGDQVLELGPDWLIPGGLCRPLVLGAGGEYYFADLANRNFHDPSFIPMEDAYNITCGDGLFDVVFSLSVAEHVRELWTWMKELARVTKVGGRIVCVNPVSWPYHESPYDCWRIMPEGYKALFEATDLSHEFSWTGNVSSLEPELVAEHGPHIVTDTIAIARRI